FAGWSVETEVEWEPRSFFTLTLGLNRATKESPHTLGSYYVASEGDLKLRYDILSSLHLRGELFYELDAYEAITAVQRNDRLLDGSVELSVTPRKWLEVGGRYVYSSRRSDLPDIDYNANIMTVFVTVDTEGKVREK
ncbi:MAG: outer membrane beta-barrel protein, partial [Nitrospinae bacterium]|nr:outer membrane beta-barrel protein [Nitrospinota bacterium]